MAEYGLHDAVDAAVEAVINTGGVLQWLVVGDDLARPGTSADDQVAQARGVPAVVRANPTVTPLLNNAAQGTCSEPSP